MSEEKEKWNGPECFAFSRGSCLVLNVTPSRDTCGRCPFRKPEQYVTNGIRYHDERGYDGEKKWP